MLRTHHRAPETGAQLPGTDRAALYLTVCMSDDIPERVSEKFGSASARPKVVRVYNPASGWVEHSKNAILTTALVAVLRASGITLVEAKWKLQRHQISLLRLPVE